MCHKLIIFFLNSLFLSRGLNLLVIMFYVLFVFYNFIYIFFKKLLYVYVSLYIITMFNGFFFLLFV